jgi:hypothetical protein
MRLDKTQRAWAIAASAILAASIAVYLRYALRAPQGPRGGSAIGLIFGTLGFGLMIFAALLGARKRVPTLRLGRAQTWMRGHLWLGALSLPLILFHGGFHFGGTLTRVLMWLLIITVVSGVFGAALQHYLPQIMTADVPLETIYDEIGHVRRLLREEADRAMASLCGSLQIEDLAFEKGLRAGGYTAARPLAAAVGVASSGSAVAVAPEILLLSEMESAPLRDFYLKEMRPFLEKPKNRVSRLSDTDPARTAFSSLRALLPAPAHATLDDLQDICDEARQLTRQEQLHHWLHGWLLVHIPLSLALIVLGVVHAVAALGY